MNGIGSERRIVGSKGFLWEDTQAKAGIDSDGFFRYFAGRDIGYAVAIGDVRRYKKPLDLTLIMVFGHRSRFFTFNGRHRIPRLQHLLKWAKLVKVRLLSFTKYASFNMC